VQLDRFIEAGKESIQPEQQQHRLQREDLADFAVIGLFNRKVIVCYNHKLRLFGFFDQHAVHERVRYEFYSWKIKAEERMVD
jgi:DNA mismatch repair ATPase MutL